MPLGSGVTLRLCQGRSWITPRLTITLLSLEGESLARNPRLQLLRLFKLYCSCPFTLAVGFFLVDTLLGKRISHALVQRTVTQDNYDTWILQSLAFRTAFLLGLNRPLPSSTDFVAQETRRRVWWFLYFCDRYTVSMGTDLRQQIDDEQCHVPMPCKESLWRGLSGPESYSPIRGKSLKNNGEGGPLSADFSSGPNLSAVGVSPTTAGVSPTNVITLINPAFAEFSQFEFQVSIGRLLAQIGDFNWREKKDRAWYNEEHLSLEKALQSWFVSLPGPVQHLGQSFSPEWSNAPNAHPHWSFVVIHILYNVAYLQLNYSRMMACIEKNASTVVSSKPLDGNGNPKGEHDKEEKDDKTMATYGGISAKVFPAEDTKLTNNGPGKPSVFKTCKAFQTCLIAARTIVQWTALVTKSNPLFLYLCRTTIYSRYQAALVLSVVLHHAVQDDPVLYSATMSDLDLLFRIFEAESRHSWITSVFVDKLRGLKADTALDFYV